MWQVFICSAYCGNDSLASAVVINNVSKATLRLPICHSAKPDALIRSCANAMLGQSVSLLRRMPWKLVWATSEPKRVQSWGFGAHAQQGAHYSHQIEG
jgi:hypothetical protein